MASDTCPYCGGIVARTDKVCPHCAKSLTATADAQSVRLPAALPTSTILLLLLAVIAGLLGLVFLSQATSGVGLIAFGCLLAVWARILQAGAHHHNLMRK